MVISNNNGIRVLESSIGFLLYNGSVFSEKVYLGVEADPAEWQEITLEEVNEIKAALEKSAEQEA